MNEKEKHITTGVGKGRKDYDAGGGGEMKGLTAKGRAAIRTCPPRRRRGGGALAGGAGGARPPALHSRTAPILHFRAQILFAWAMHSVSFHVDDVLSGLPPRNRILT